MHIFRIYLIIFYNMRYNFKAEEVFGKSANQPVVLD